MLLVLVGFVIRGNVQRKKANTLLAVQNEEINKQKLEIEQQKHIVEEQQKEVLDSIRYAKRIQNAHLPNEKYILKSIERLKKN